MTGDPDPPPQLTDRIVYLPIALALGLFVGDLITMLIRDELALGRVAVSGLTSIAVYVLVRWFVRRPRRRDRGSREAGSSDGGRRDRLT